MSSARYSLVVASLRLLLVGAAVAAGSAAHGQAGFTKGQRISVTFATPGLPDAIYDSPLAQDDLPLEQTRGGATCPAPPPPLCPMSWADTTNLAARQAINYGVAQAVAITVRTTFQLPAGWRIRLTKEVNQAFDRVVCEFTTGDRCTGNDTAQEAFVNYRLVITCPAGFQANICARAPLPFPDRDRLFDCK
jgi:hypothetical protein